MIFTLESSLGNDHFLASYLVLYEVELDSQIAEVVTDDVSHGDVVFADAGSEYDSIYAVHLSDVSSDVESYLMSEYLEGQQSSFVSVLCSCSSRSLKSLETPEIPSTPDFLLRISFATP